MASHSIHLSNNICCIENPTNISLPMLSAQFQSLPLLLSMPCVTSVFSSKIILTILNIEYFFNNFLCKFTVNLSSEILDKLKIYRENFEKAYLEATGEFYKTQAAAYLQENGVQNYMKYVSV